MRGVSGAGAINPPVCVWGIFISYQSYSYCWFKFQAHRQSFTDKVRQCHSNKVNKDTLNIPNVGEFDLSTQKYDVGKEGHGFDTQVNNKSQYVL